MEQRTSRGSIPSYTTISSACYCQIQIAPEINELHKYRKFNGILSSDFPTSSFSLIRVCTIYINRLLEFAQDLRPSCRKRVITSSRSQIEAKYLMTKHDITCETPCSDILNMKSQRDQMLILHRRIMENARKALRTRTEVSHENTTTDLLCALTESEEIIKRQCKKIDELAEIQYLYKNLKLQYNILEETNEKLVEQILALDDRVDEKEELEQLVSAQKDTLSKLRKNMRLIENKYEQSIKKIQLYNQENSQLHTMLEQQKNNFSVFLDQYKKEKADAEKLRKVLRNQEMSQTQLMSQYEDLRSEYEALYENLSNANSEVS